MTLFCRTLDDVEEQSANGIGNPIWQIEVLCGEIRSLNRRILALENAKRLPDRDISSLTTYGL
jgi:hypothetical protein